MFVRPPKDRKKLEPLCVVAFDDLQAPRTGRSDPRDQFARVAAIGPNAFHPKLRPHVLALGENQLRSVTILDVRGVNHDD